MRIAVAGGGIAGTAVSKLLADRGHDVTIFEQATECKPVGAGILLQPSGQIVLQQLGILDSIIAESAQLDGLSARQTSGRILVRLKYEWLDPNLFGLGVHRGKLYQALLELCLRAGVQVHTNFRVVATGVDARGLSWITSARNETTGDFDFVVAADGSRSAIRENSALKSTVIDYDHAALWMTGPCDYQPKTLVQVVRGTQALVGLLPIGKGESSFFWGLPGDGYDSLVSRSLDDWKRDVREICPQADSLLSCVGKFSDLTFARYRHVTMSSWHTEHVLFIGDAAHATSPHLGQGVNLALEDASCFAHALDVSQDFLTACGVFTRTRKAKLRYYQQLTRLLSPFFQSHGVLRGRLRDTFLPLFPHTPLVRREMIRSLCGIKKGWIG